MGNESPPAAHSITMRQRRTPNQIDIGLDVPSELRSAMSGCSSRPPEDAVAAAPKRHAKRGVPVSFGRKASWTPTIMLRPKIARSPWPGSRATFAVTRFVHKRRRVSTIRET